MGVYILIEPEIIERFSRQILVRDIGVKGLAKIRKTRVAIIGCGATGSAQAELLARLGIGFIRVIDRDFVDISNLPRTYLFKYEDAKKAIPKAIACAERIKEIDPTIKVEPVIAKVTPYNISNFIKDVDVIVDGTDNLLTRFIINDAAIKYNRPWIFVGVVSWYGNTMFIKPDKGPCFRCLTPTRLLEREEERRGACEVLGVVNTVVALTSSISVTLLLKYILGLEVDYNTLYIVDGKNLEVNKVKVNKNNKCIACVYRKLEFLEGKKYLEGNIARICGTNAVEIIPYSNITIDPKEFSKLFSEETIVALNPYAVKIKVNNKITLTIFRDGRAIVEGTIDERYAWRIYEEHVLNKLNKRGT